MKINKVGGMGFILLGLIIGLAACGSQNNVPRATVTPDFFGIGEELSRQLIVNRRRSFGQGEKLVFTSLVDLDQLHTTSKFGRTISEALATSLFRHGYGVEEIRKIAGILIKDNQGEIILSREAQRLAHEQNCDLIVAGTYSVTPVSVILNVKFLDSNSSEVISVAGLELKRSNTINYLLSDGEGLVDAPLSAYERW